MRLLYLFPLLLPAILLLPSSGYEERAKLGPAARMQAAPVRFDPGDPAHLRTGALTYLGGVELTSPDPAFGGFSTMHVAGDRFTLVSDGGNIVRFRMGTDWRPREVRFADLSVGPGTGWNKSSRDVEAVAFDPGGRHAWVSFEQVNMIWRYDAGLARAEARARPVLMADWGNNGGAESLVRLRDGSFVAISETARVGRDRDTRAAVHFAGDPADPRTPAYGFALIPPRGYDPSEAALLPDGRLLVLARLARPAMMLRLAFRDIFAAKLVLVDPRGIAPGARVEGREIAAIDAPFTRDNFEAMAVVREGSRTILWLASDDNRAWYQRSLLMKFRLDLPPRKPAAGSAITPPSKPS